MTKKNGGFTLMELLVVVLIIGILAAVALPQYQLAVGKSKYATLKNTVFPMIHAVQLYYLANGTKPSGFDDLDIDIPGRINSTTARFNKITCRYDPTTYNLVFVECSFAVSSDSIILRSHFYTDGSYKIINSCVTGKENTLGNKICASETRKQGTLSSAGNEMLYRYY